MARSLVDGAHDFDELRQLTKALEIANRQLVDVLTRKCKELAAHKVSEGELQQTVALVESTTRKAQ